MTEQPRTVTGIHMAGISRNPAQELPPACLGSEPRFEPTGLHQQSQHQSVAQDNKITDHESSALETEAPVGTTDWQAGKREKLTVAAMGVIMLLVALDTDILVPALPTLATDLKGSSVETFWVGTSFLLASATFVPFIGATSEILGRQIVLMFCVVMFTVGSLVCCLANNFTALLVGRTVQGIGGGGLYTMTTIVITDIVPLDQRPKYLSIISAVFGRGGILGPLAGGLIVQYTTWRWLFYINFPFCGIALVVVPLFVRSNLQTPGRLLFGIKRIDWTGGLIFIAGSSTFLVGLTWAGVNYPWSSYQAWLPILLGGLAVVGSLLYERPVPSEPFLRLSVFYSPHASIVFALTLIQGLLLYMQLYYLPFYFQVAKGATTVLSGIYLMAVDIILFPIAVTCGILMTKFGTFTWAIQIGFISMTLASGLFLLANQNLNMVKHLFIFLVVGVAHGFLIGSLNVATQAISQAQDLVFAISMWSFLRWFGSCLGVAVGGAVFNNVLLHSLVSRGVDQAEFISQNSESFGLIVKALPDGDEKTTFVWAYLDGFRGIFYLMLALSSLSMLLSFYLKNHDLKTGKRVTDSRSVDAGGA
ncbi:hypothetical protein QWA68_015092 [Fusarium oxysporum]|nr:hypothetical protein QWA68_015092 [Fusarium oxysporum]